MVEVQYIDKYKQVQSIL